MPPLCSWDEETLGPVFMLGQALDESTGIIRQVVKLNYRSPASPDDRRKPMFDMKREFERASYELDEEIRPAIELLNDPTGTSVALLYSLDVDPDVIGEATKLLLEHLDTRIERHLRHLKDPAAGRIVYAEVEKH